MNKYRRNRHLAIRNIQRTSWLGTMTYREARRKYKAGYRAIPVGKGYFTKWFLLNFGSDGLTLAQLRKLGEEYTRISEHAESAQYMASMQYSVEMHCFVFKYKRPSSTWRFALSLEQVVLLIDGGRLAEFTIRCAEHDISDLCQFKNADIRCPYYGISHYVRDEDFNEIAAHSARYQTQGIRLTPIFAGYGIIKVDK